MSEFTAQEMLKICQAAIKRWAELTIEEIGKDINEIPTLNIVDEIYLRGLWSKRLDQLLEIHKEVPKSRNEADKWDLLFERFPDVLGLPSVEFKPDISNRFEIYKKRLLREYERDVFSAIDIHGVTSPIEQLFIMEWKISRLEDKFDIQLRPQKPIETLRGKFTIDFFIASKVKGKDFKIAVELDGHDFHEKSKEQVEKDKKRERSIIQEGITVLRFSGSEIVRNVRGCIKEVEDYLTQLYK